MNLAEIEITEIQSLVRRRFLWILIPLVSGLGLAVLALRLTPPVYEASTLILVEGQKVPSTYVRPTVTSNIDQRLKSIRQQVTNHDSLKSIIEEANLYQGLGEELSQDAIIARAKRALSVRVLPGQVFEISFRGSDPDSVAHVANTLADRFIDENLKFRERHAANTTQFLQEELEKTTLELEQREQALVEFRLMNDGYLPEQRQANFNAIEQLQTRLQITNGDLEAAELRMTLLERDKNAYAASLQPIDSKGPSRLEELQQELSSLQAKFTSNHPDIVRLQAEIDQLINSGAHLEEEDIANSSTGSPSDPQIQAEIDQAQMTSDRLKGERDRLLEQISVYQRRIERSASIEQQLTSQTRDYDNLRDSYESLLNKRIEARLAEDLELKQQSEQFRKLEQARPPSQPVSPNPSFYLLVGTVLGGMLGIGLALIRERTDETLDSEDAVKKAFPGLSYVISIPHLTVPKDQDQGDEDGPISAEMA